MDFQFRPFFHVDDDIYHTCDDLGKLSLPSEICPDITVMVDWALKINYLSIYLPR